VMQSIRGQLAGQGVLGNIKGAFVSIMKIERDIKGVCERLPDALYENLNQPGNRERFEELIKKAVRSGLEKEFDPVLHESSARGKLLDAVMDRVWSKRNFARLARGAEKLARAGLDQPMAESVDKLGLSASVTGALDETAIRIARMLSADATRTFLGEQIDEVFQLFLNRPIGKLGRLVSAETVDHIAAAVADEARLMLRSRLSGFADEAGVWDIIVESIESYDNQRLARLVQQLARSELRWVTVLGGVIGAVVGILQTFLHTLDIL
ncbi:MAG: DUF445 domain-containing protein, partial [Planctomycetes bacterium]|nr:DUF445 domain-containing protein [Planctomycetota bacterium]